MDDRIGQQFGKYRLIHLLGQGGFGEVWKALHMQLQRSVAIKLLHVNLKADPEFAKRFEHEVRAVASLEHPNIVQIYDFGVIRPPESNTPIAYVVMRYIEGRTLADYIASTSARERVSSPVEIVHLFTSIGLAVDYAHQNGMVHGDIKPANILLDIHHRERNPMGEPILTDFGLAKLLGVSAGAPTATHFGTSLYASPEQAQGLPGDERSDIYSLGIILYEMTTGITPFRDDNQPSIIMQHRYTAPIPPAFINPAIPPALSEVIFKSIAKDPDARFQSASAMTIALANAFNISISAELRPPEVFFSYAHQDKGLRERLENHLSNLKYRGLITTWHDREIQAGEEWARQIDIYLDKAHIILLLISPDFMASQYCYGIEMKQALERYERREADVIPILLRPVLYTDAPFAKLQMLPTNGKPVVNWRNRDSAFVDIALGIGRVAQRRLESPTPVGAKFPSSAGSLYPTPSGSGFRPDQGFQDFYGSNLPSPLPPAAQLRSRGGVLILVGLGFLGLLSAGVLLFLLMHPSFIPFVGAIVGSLILLAGILFVIRTLVRKAQSKAARRREQERAQRRQLEEAQRREQEESRHRELEESGRREQERTYYEKALAAYEQALSQNNTDAMAYRGKGNALVGLGLYNEALTAFEQAVALTPLPTTYVSMGNVLAILRRRDEALTAYEQALALDASYASAYAGMSEALLQLGRTQEARHMRERAEQLGYEE